jgi:hypothetical protein
MLPTTPQVAVKRDSGLTPAPVIIESRQQRFAASLANKCSSNLRKLHQNPSAGTLLCCAVKTEQEDGQMCDRLDWPVPREDSWVTSVIVADTTAGKRTIQRWASDIEAKLGAGVWM